MWGQLAPHQHQQLVPAHPSHNQHKDLLGRNHSFFTGDIFFLLCSTGVPRGKEGRDMGLKMGREGWHQAPASRPLHQPSPNPNLTRRALKKQEHMLQPGLNSPSV